MKYCKFKIILPILFSLLQNGISISRIDPLVDSKVGLIRGLRADDGDYSMFLGIPYATVDKSNPFGPSSPHPSFDDVFEAYNDSAICSQFGHINENVVESLDCLNLNIFVPNSANSRNRLPVLVWIHGGGFIIGSSDRFLYGEGYLVKQDIILVTLNYRLGPYGFMCLDQPQVPGNQGLKDQKLALKWIKNNIDAFGGDSNKITIFGESAGGISVDFHLIYSHEKLFDKVIMQSGNALFPWAILEPDTSAHLKLSKHLGFTTTDTEEALAFLATVDTHLLIASVSELGLDFRPCVEKDFNNNQQFIYEYPINIKPNIGNVPILLGYNSDESLNRYETMSPEGYATLDLFYDFVIEYLKLDDQEVDEMEQYLRHFYIGDEKISVEEKQGLINFNSDFFFNYPAVRTVQKYLNSGAKNIYHYVFAYDGGRNYAKNRDNVTAPGAAHEDELGYLFDMSFMDKPTPEDQLIVDRMTTLWANFAKYGNPTPQTTDLLPVQWPAVTQGALNYLQIDSQLKVARRNYKSRMAFWDLFYKLNEKAEIGYKDTSK